MPTWLGAPELIIILAILLLLFGSTKLPGLGRSMGQSIRGFRSGLKGEGGDKDEKSDAPDASADDDAKKDEKS
jgi:sec-independent protein translocase protein TatA